MATKKTTIQHGPFAGREGVLQIAVAKVSFYAGKKATREVGVVDVGDVRDSHEYCKLHYGPGLYEMIALGEAHTRLGAPTPLIEIPDSTGKVPAADVGKTDATSIGQFLPAGDAGNYLMHFIANKQHDFDRALDTMRGVMDQSIDAMGKLHEMLFDKAAGAMKEAAEVLVKSADAAERRVVTIHTDATERATKLEASLAGHFSALCDRIEAQTRAVNELVVTVRERAGDRDQSIIRWYQDRVRELETKLETALKENTDAKIENVKLEVLSDDRITKKDGLEFLGMLMNMKSGAKSREPPALPAPKPENGAAHSNGAPAPAVGSFDAKPAPAPEPVTITLPEGVTFGGQKTITIPHPSELLAKIREGRPLTKAGHDGDTRNIAIFKAMRAQNMLPVEYDEVVREWEAKHGTLDLSSPMVQALLSRTA